jgi:hypothetical protein
MQEWLTKSIPKNEEPFSFDPKTTLKELVVSRKINLEVFVYYIE